MEPQAGEIAEAAAARVVLLTRDASFGERIDQAVGGRANVVRAASGYEVAAELLAIGAGAVVLDLGAMSRRDAGLPAIVREAEAAAFAVGELPGGLSGDELYGIRIVSRDDVGALVAEQLGRTKAFDETEPASPDTTAQTEGGPAVEPSGSGEAEAEAAPTPAEPTQTETPPDVADPSPEQADKGGEADRDGEHEPPSQESSASDSREKEPDGTYVSESDAEETARPGEPSGLLTPEELDALLRSDL